MVTLNEVLNMREEPGGEKIGRLPKGVTLSVLARQPGWFKVDFYGVQGWVSAVYVSPQAGCE